VRNRLRREALKRGYLQKADVSEQKSPPIELSGDERVPPLADPIPVAENSGTKEEVHAKIQRHIDQIKARKQKMRECYAQAQEMLHLNEAYENAKARAR
jgi:hypothetical protein